MAGKKAPMVKVGSRPDIIRRKADDERREAVIKVLATADEKDAWKAQADAAGMTVSTWLRHLAIKATRIT